MPTLPSTFVFTDDMRLHDPVDVAATLPQHWGIVFRHYISNKRRSLAHELAKVCHARSLVFLIAADWRLACEVRADGVHMPEGVLRSGTVSPMLNATRTMLLTTSAHGAAGLHLASSLNADAVFLSPVRATVSHDEISPIGVLPFAAMAQASHVPVYALGGVGSSDVLRLQALGAAGVAGISLYKKDF
ncbi:MAG: thiamine phosphate synthase [Rhodospirillaceae bacterium]|nr:thiamine phosphate synthase [Rhodospirillaceae bacterium]